MTDQTKSERLDEMQDKSSTQRQERRERRAQRRADRQAGGSGWIAGLLLIAIGGLYMLNQFGYLPQLTNWWALFLLLPGFGTLAAAAGAYRRNGNHWTAEVTGPFLGGLLLLGLTAMFLFNLSLSWLWPLFLIGAGLLLLFRSTASQSD